MSMFGDPLNKTIRPAGHVLEYGGEANFKTKQIHLHVQDCTAGHITGQGGGEGGRNIAGIDNHREAGKNYPI